MLLVARHLEHVGAADIDLATVVAPADTNSAEIGKLGGLYLVGRLAY